MSAADARAAHRVLVAEHFDSEALYWRDVYDDADVQGMIYRERRAAALALVDGLGLPRGSRILEIGCGAGSAAVALAERGHFVQAVDTVPRMIELTRRLAEKAGLADRIVAAVGDIHALGFADETFSLVLALGVAPWLDSLEGPLREVRRVLCPGGHLIVSADNRWRLNAILDPRLFPVFGSLRARLRRVVDRVGDRSPGARVRMHTVSEFDRLLAASGFQKVQGRTLGFGPFTLFNLPLASGTRGVRLHRALQRLADRGVPVLRGSGAQYLVVARPVPRAEAATTLARGACR